MAYFNVCIWFSSLAADSYEWGSQSSGIGAYIGGDDSCHPPLPPEELSHYWQEFTVTPADLWHCFLLYIFARSLFVTEAHGAERSPSTRYIQFSI